MARLLHQLAGRTDLDAPTAVHHEDSIGNLADHSEVVADQDHGKLIIRLDLFDQVEDLALDRDIER